MTFDALPLYDRLRAQRETCELGLRAALGTEREGHYRACLTEVERKIALLVQPIDRLTALRTRRRQCEAMIEKGDRQAWERKAYLVQAAIERLEAGL